MGHNSELVHTYGFVVGERAVDQLVGQAMPDHDLQWLSVRLEVVIRPHLLVGKRLPLVAESELLLVRGQKGRVGSDGCDCRVSAI